MKIGRGFFIELFDPYGIVSSTVFLALSGGLSAVVGVIFGAVFKHNDIVQACLIMYGVAMGAKLGDRVSKNLAQTHTPKEQ